MKLETIPLFCPWCLHSTDVFSSDPSCDFCGHRLLQTPQMLIESIVEHLQDALEDLLDLPEAVRRDEGWYFEVEGIKESLGALEYLREKGRLGPAEPSVCDLNYWRIERRAVAPNLERRVAAEEQRHREALTAEERALLRRFVVSTLEEEQHLRKRGLGQVLDKARRLRS